MGIKRGRKALGKKQINIRLLPEHYSLLENPNPLFVHYRKKGIKMKTDKHGSSPGFTPSNIVAKLIHDKRLDSAAEYHNTYLSNMRNPDENITNNTLVIGHGEDSIINDLTYVGKNPLIPLSTDRVKKYCDWTVNPHGEVCLGGTSLSFISFKSTKYFLAFSG